MTTQQKQLAYLEKLEVAESYGKQFTFHCSCKQCGVKAKRHSSVLGATMFITHNHNGHSGVWIDTERS